VTTLVPTPKLPPAALQGPEEIRIGAGFGDAQGKPLFGRAFTQLTIS
jgi:hypothetical protein